MLDVNVVDTEQPTHGGRHKLVPLYLEAATYARLARAGVAEDRDPVQQARWIVRLALEGGTSSGEGVGPRETATQRRVEAGAA